MTMKGSDSGAAVRRLYAKDKFIERMTKTKMRQYNPISIMAAIRV
jgi:hypothetical protein